MPTLLGPDGAPLQVSRADLTRDLLDLRLYAQRTRLASPLARGLTPARLAQILDSAASGYAYEYLTLAEELEERDPHYASVLGTRKRAVLGLERKVVAATDKRADQKLADMVRRLVATPEFGMLLAKLLDALGKGYSVAEIQWDTTSTPWTPNRYVWRDPRWFVLDRDDGETLRFNPSGGWGSDDAVPLPPARFIIHKPRLKMGLPIRGGLARLVSIISLCRQITLESWLSYAESYGAPTRIAKADDRFFSAGADAAQQTFLQDIHAALETMLGSNAHAVLPKSVDVQLQAAVAGQSDIFAQLLEHLEKLISKAVLGRSDAADATAGRLGGETAQSEVRQDLLESDAEELQNTINAQLIQPFIDLNFGRQPDYPRFLLHFPKQDDLAGLTDLLAKLVPLGLKVEQSVIRDKFNLPDPAPDAELLEAPAMPVPAFNRALNQIPPGPPFAKGGGEAGEILDPTAPLVERLGAEADPLIDALLNPVRLLLDTSADLDAFRAGLLDIYPDLDAADFATLMGQALAVADAQGRWEARP